jgi:hypothetical protein
MLTILREKFGSFGEMYYICERKQHTNNQAYETEILILIDGCGSCDGFRGLLGG